MGNSGLNGWLLVYVIGSIPVEYRDGLDRIGLDYSAYNLWRLVSGHPRGPTAGEW